MRILVFVVLVVSLAGFLFWKDIFKSDLEEAVSTEVEMASNPGDHAPDDGDKPSMVVIPESDPPAAPNEPAYVKSYEDLMREGKWEEANALLDTIPIADSDLTQLYYRHLCLMRLKRNEMAKGLLKEILRRDSNSPEAVLAVLDVVEGENLTPLEQRKSLSQVAGGYGKLEAPHVARLVAIVKEINEGLPGSIKDWLHAKKYTVVANDCLWDICKKHNKTSTNKIETGLLCLVNGIKGDRIYPGQVLRIPLERMSIKIWRKNWLLGVFLGDKLLCAYQVGLGRKDSTPEGEFMIKTRLKNPDWYSDKHGKIIPFSDPENILGTRWLGFDNQENARGLGIHGTKDPDSIGKNRSSGCIRLVNEDMEDLFDVIPRGTSVTVM